MVIFLHHTHTRPLLTFSVSYKNTLKYDEPERSLSFNDPSAESPHFQGFRWVCIFQYWPCQLSQLKLHHTNFHDYIKIQETMYRGCSKFPSRCLRLQIVLDPFAKFTLSILHRILALIIVQLLQYTVIIIKVHWMCFLSKCLILQIYCSSILTMHFTMLVQIFFLLNGFTGRRFISSIDLSHLSIFFSLLSQELSPFHLKEAVHSFSLAYPNCQHHYSCIWGLIIK